MYDNNFQDIREGVIDLCSRFEGKYWRDLDRTREYPEEFVKALTESGFLGCLIPEKYGNHNKVRSHSKFMW